MKSNEIWKPIKDFEGLYEVSNLGRVKSLSRLKHPNCGRYYLKEKILKIWKNPNGYYATCLSKNGNHTKTIHRLVAETFIPNQNNYPCVNHKDEDKSNNCVDNLEWCTWEYNNNYKNKGERISKTKFKKVSQYDLEGNYIKEWESILGASKQLNISSSGITNCIHGRSKSAGGYIWKVEG